MKSPIPPRAISLTLRELHEAAPSRLPGYMEECMRRGQLDESKGVITFTSGDFVEIRQQFNPNSGNQFFKGCCG